MVPWIKCLSCKHEELSSNLEHPLGKLDVFVLIYSPNLVWEADRCFSEFADYQLGQSLSFE